MVWIDINQQTKIDSGYLKTRVGNRITKIEEEKDSTGEMEN